MNSHIKKSKEDTSMDNFEDNNSKEKEDNSEKLEPNIGKKLFSFEDINFGDEEDVPKKPNSVDRRCHCCGRGESELAPYGGPDDPMVHDFTGWKLVFINRPYCPPIHGFDLILKEAYKRYSRHGFENAEEWLVGMFGKEVAQEICNYEEAQGYIYDAYDCRDCIILDPLDYYLKEKMCHSKISKNEETTDSSKSD
jgi:hypothetical protein